MRQFLLLLSWGLLGQCLLAQESHSFSLNLAAPDIHDFVFVEESPIILNLEAVKYKIGYPLPAIKEGVEGTTHCRILIDEQGHPRDHVITKSLHPSIDDRIDVFVRELRFSPARVDDSSIMYWTNLSLHFGEELKADTELRRLDVINFLKHPSGTSLKDAKHAMSMGLAALADRRYADARWKLQHCIQLTPRRKRPRGQVLDVLLTAHYYLGKVERKTQRWDQAAIHFTETIGLAQAARELSPSSEKLLSQSFLDRGRTRLTSGQIVGALEDANWIIRFSEDTHTLSEAYVLLSQVELELGKIEGALQMVQQAIDMEPEMGAAYLQKANILIGIGGHDAACEILEEVKDKTASLSDQARVRWAEMRMDYCGEGYFAGRP